MIGRAVAAVCLLFALSWFAAACGDDLGPFAGARRLPAPIIQSTMPTVDGAPFVFEAVDDGVLLVYFGFTSCPDICPTTLADVAFAEGDLGDQRERVDLAMVSVDPERDQPEVLRGYVSSFVADATALRTDDDAVLRAAAAEFGVFYEIVEAADGSVDVLHSTSLFAVDDKGQLVASWPFGTPSADLANDLRILLEEA